MNMFSGHNSVSESKCIVKVQTEAYKRGDTYFYGKSIRVLQKLTTYDVLRDECDNVGICDGLENILNLNSVKDGKYYLQPINISKDIETGYIDDWDFKLIPFDEEQNEKQI